MLKPSVRVVVEGGILVAEFFDCLRLDPAPVQELRHFYEEHVRGGGRGALVVDLNGVSFAGSASLSGFLNIQREIRNRGGKDRVIFCNLDPGVREVFRVTRIEPLFRFESDREAALALANATEPPTDGLVPAAKPKAPIAPPPGPSPLAGRRRRS